MHAITNLINKSWNNSQINILCQFYNGIFDNYLANDVSLFGSQIPNWEDSYVHENISLIKEHENLYIAKIEEVEDENRHNTLLIINDFPPQEHGFLSHILQEFGGILIGNNGDLSSARPKKEWYKLMEDSKIFVNLSNRPNIPYPLLYAMDRGCSVVSNLTEGLDLFLNDGKNCLIGKSHEEIISHIKLLLNHQGLREVSVKGKETINREFSLSDFNENWKSLFNEIKQKVFLR